MKNKFTLLRIFISILLLSNLSVGEVTASSGPPEFPSCVNPQGNVIANYANGTHGVVGVATSYQGTDTVYAVSENVVVQCLCTDQGEGIQTNWWKIMDLTSEEIEDYKTQGWVFVPDGSVWGLDPAEYLAMNANYSCRSSNGGNSVNASSTSSSSSGGIASLGDILSLAATGNIKTIYSLLILGFLSLITGYLLKRKSV